jgi:Tol biopolymer transport system component
MQGEDREQGPLTTAAHHDDSVACDDIEGAENSNLQGRLQPESSPNLRGLQRFASGRQRFDSTVCDNGDVGAGADRGTWPRPGCRILSALAALIVLWVLCATAAATPPGPNGQIVFRRYGDQARTFGELFTADPGGTRVRQITHPPAGVLDTNPDWSPDGRRIAFQRVDPNGCGLRCETAEIFLVRRDGSGLTRLLYDQSGAGCARNGRSAGGVCRNSPAWSPDGRRLAFTCEVLAGPERAGFERICVARADGSGVRQLGPNNVVAADGWAQWSPDGSRFAVQRAIGSRRAVFLLKADGTGARQLTPWRLRGGEPDWSPDGKRILFTSNADGPDNVSANLYTVRPDGTGLRQLTHARGGSIDYLSASFSPDGRWITFARTPGAGAAGNADVFVARDNGTSVRAVTRTATWDSATDWGRR